MGEALYLFPPFLVGVGGVPHVDIPCFMGKSGTRADFLRLLGGYYAPLLSCRFVEQPVRKTVFQQRMGPSPLRRCA